MTELLEQSGIDLSSSVSIPQSSRNRFSNSSGRIKKVRKHLIRTPQMYNPLSTPDDELSTRSHVSSTPRSGRITLSYSVGQSLPSS
jgi:hypothetical protein